jgi:mitochondrial fission protein ELM1
MESQCVGLAEALGFRCELKRVAPPRTPLNYLPPNFWPNPIGGTLAPPWPRVLISSGRGSVAAALAIGRASPKTFTVHIQTPYVAASCFDLVVIPEHDALRGDNVLITRTALHGVTVQKLAEARKYFGPRLSYLPRPLIAVLVGGSNKHHPSSAKMMYFMADQLIAAVRECGGSLAVTPSRRTEKETEEILRNRLSAVPLFFWDGLGENPYLGLLALADAIVVTSDSVSMVSEACATGKPVHVFFLGEPPKKLRQFYKRLMDDALTRPFLGRIEHWHYDPPKDTERIAAIVRGHLQRANATPHSMESS